MRVNQFLETWKTAATSRSSKKMGKPAMELPDNTLNFAIGSTILCRYLMPSTGLHGNKCTNHTWASHMNPFVRSGMNLQFAPTISQMIDEDGRFCQSKST